jgi:Family of unknown function (DUF6509)
MFSIVNHSAEHVKDPFGILSGERYEFLLYLDVPEDDELHSEQGVYAKIIVKRDQDQSSIVTYDLFEQSTNRYLDFELEPEEEQALLDYCTSHI